MADSSNLPPPALPRASAGSPLGLAAVLIIAVGALYVGASIFVPLVLAILLTFALAPLVRVLDKLRVPHVLAVLLSVFGAAMLLGLLAFLIITQLAHLASEIPQYQQVVANKLKTLQDSTDGGEVFSRIAKAIQDFGADTNTVRESGLGASVAEPMPVTIVNPPQSPLNYVQAILGSLLGPLATAAIVTVFVVFLLLEREDFRDRFLKLVSRGDLRTSTQAMNEAGKRVSRYLLVQFSVNLTYGLIFGTGLFFIGIPNAILWGLFAALFRYIPFVGTLIAASIPFALAFSIDPGWGMLLQAVALFVCLEMVVTNAIEPRLYGSSTGLSALAVIVAAMFWATLWGPIGLILATPLTVCLVVLGRYVPQLRFLEIMLGSEPVLVREEQLYQRLISGNTEEAIDVAEGYVSEHSPHDFYDDVAVPALRLADTDRMRNISDIASRRTVAEAMAAVVLEIEEFDAGKEAEEGAVAKAPLSVLCIGGRSELDAAAANMVAHLVRRSGSTSKTLPPVAVRQEGIGQMDLDGVDVICLTYLDANPRTYVRFVARRIGRRAPGIKIVVCALGLTQTFDADEVAASLGVSAVRTSVTAAADAIDVVGRVGTTADASNDAKGSNVEKLPGLDFEVLARREHYLDDYTAQVANAFDCQMAIVTFAKAADPERKYEPGMQVIGETVMALDDIIVVHNVAESADFAENSFLVENGVQFYAGVPLRSPDGEVIGTLSIIDQEPRSFSSEDKTKLWELAGSFSAHVLDAAKQLKAG
jgi:predicted PurR-regulated permease PerM